MNPTHIRKCLQNAGFKRQKGRSGAVQEVWSRFKGKRDDVTFSVNVWTGIVPGTNDFSDDDRIVKGRVLVTGMTRPKGERYNRAEGVSLRFDRLSPEGLLDAMRVEWSSLACDYQKPLPRRQPRGTNSERRRQRLAEQQAAEQQELFEAEQDTDDPGVYGPSDADIRDYEDAERHDWNGGGCL